MNHPWLTLTAPEKTLVRWTPDQFNIIINNLLKSFPDAFISPTLVDEWKLLRVPTGASFDARRAALLRAILDGLTLEREDTLTEKDGEEPNPLQLVGGRNHSENTFGLVSRTTEGDMTRPEFWHDTRDAILNADEAASAAERTHPPLNECAESQSIIDQVNFDVKRIKQFATRSEQMAEAAWPKKSASSQAQTECERYVEDKIAEAKAYARINVYHSVRLNKHHLFSVAIVRSIIQQARKPHAQHALAHRRATRRRYSVGVHTDSEAD